MSLTTVYREHCKLVESIRRPTGFINAVRESIEVDCEMGGDGESIAEELFGGWEV